MADPKDEGSGNDGADTSADVAKLISEKFAELKTEVVADMNAAVTGAVSRQVKGLSDKLEGLDFEALKGYKPPAPKGGEKKPDNADTDIEVSKLRRELDEERTEAKKWRALGLRAKVLDAVDLKKVSKDSRDLLADKFLASVHLTTGGELAVKEGEMFSPLGDVLDTYLKDRPGLLQSSARPGTDSGGANGSFAEPMPKTKAELMFKTVENSAGKKTQVATGERRDAFIATHGQDKWDALPMK